MKLSPEDTELFYSLYHPLLAYVNVKLEVVNGFNCAEDIRKLSLDDIQQIRKKLYEQPELIDGFAGENPLSLSDDKLRIIRDWKYFVGKQFYIVRYLKKHAVFLDANPPSKAYGVLALTSTFEEMLGPHLPILVEAVLLPFKGNIIYDSLFIPYSISFGGNIRRSLNDSYQRAKAAYDIITSLPFPPEKEDQSDVEKLKFYLRSPRSRDLHRDEIDALIHKNQELLIHYHQEMGKIHARRLKKELLKIGLQDAWVAVLDGMPIASGTSKKEVVQILARILPANKRSLAYVFRVK